MIMDLTGIEYGVKLQEAFRFIEQHELKFIDISYIADRQRILGELEKLQLGKPIRVHIP